MDEIKEPRSVSDLSLDDIIREFVFWTERVREASQELWAYKSALIEYAHSTRTGQNTVHLETIDGRQKIKVEFKKKLKAEQMEVECARGLLLTDEEERNLPAEKEFRDLFKIEYVPKAAGLKKFFNTLSGDERTATAKEMIKDAVSEVEQQPYLTVEKQ